MHGAWAEMDDYGVQAGDSTGSLTAAQEADELRNQLRRLERLIHAIQTAPEPLRRKIAAAARNFAPKKQPEVIDIETADVVGALARLCFSNATYQHDVPLVTAQAELVSGAKAALAAAEPHPGPSTAYKPIVTARTVSELVALLPTWTEAQALIDMYATCWWGSNDLLFPPMWAAKVAGMYASGFRPLPHPHFLAEIFGVMALSHRGRATEQGSTSLDHQEADNFAAYCQRALDVGAYLDKPSLEGIRSLALLVAFHAFWGTALARGLTVLPVALSLVMQLDFHRPDGDFEGAETPAESFERRALVSALVRSDWFYPHTLGRASIADPKVFLATPPQMVEDEKLPSDALYADFRPRKPVVEAMIARHHLARLHQRMTTELFATNRMRISSAAIARYAREIDHLEATYMTPPLQYVDDFGRRVWKEAEVDDMTAIARIHACADFALVRVRLHKPFIGGRAALAMAPDSFDESMHRENLIKWSQVFLWLWTEARRFTQGCYVSTFSCSFDPILSLALIIILHPDLPDRHALRADLGVFPDQADSPGSPPAVRRLARVVRFLLQHADTIPDAAASASPPRKRQRTSDKAAAARRASVSTPSGPAMMPSMPLPMVRNTPPAISAMPLQFSTFAPATVGSTTAGTLWPGMAPNPTSNGGLEWTFGAQASPAAPMNGFGVDHLAGMTTTDALSAVNGHANDVLGDLGVDLGSNGDPLAFLRGMDQGWLNGPTQAAAGTATGQMELDDALMKAFAGGA